LRLTEGKEFFVMKKFSGLVVAFAVASMSVGTVIAQNAYVAAAGEGTYAQPNPAPIERAAAAQDGPGSAAQGDGYGATQNGARPGEGSNEQQPPSVVAMHPAKGVTVRADQATEVKTVASDAQHTEIRLERGVANVEVRDPAPDMLILVDLPGGQTQLLKNGFYTFNAGTNTARVFSGEADAFASANDKPMHVKGGDQAVFASGRVRVSYSDPYYSHADVLAGAMNGSNEGGGQGQGYDRGYGATGEAYGGGYDGGYGYAPYGAYYGGSPYYAYGYPYGYYGGGYPYFGYGLGFGYGFGGYYGGYGYRGGYGYGGGYRGGYGGGYGGRGYPGGGVFHPGATSGGSFHGGSAGSGGAAHSSGGGGHR
jgi:hypothetical protein